MPTDLLFIQKERAHRSKRPWHGTAFIIEALVILLCLAASSAILMQMFGIAFTRGDDAARLSHAVILASNDAEAFAADPTDEPGDTLYDLVDGQLVSVDTIDEETYVVSRSTSEEKTKAGILYNANISIMQNGDVLYELETAKYLKSSGVTR